MSLGPIVITNNGAVVQTIMEQQPVIVQSQGAALVVQRSSNSVVSRSTQTVVTPIVQTQVVQQITTGPQGPPGSSEPTFAVTAGEDLTSPVVVAIDNGVAHAADPTNTSDMTSQLAVTTQAAAAGASVLVATSISMTEPLWSWVPGRVFLSLTGGQLTQSPADTGALLEVGRAVSPTTIDFNIQTAILR